jgi:hypothetical protein
VKFISTLWNGRNRPPRESVQERIAQYTLTQPRNVQAAPVKPPLKDKRNG